MANDRPQELSITRQPVFYGQRFTPSDKGNNTPALSGYDVIETPREFLRACIAKKQTLGEPELMQWVEHCLKGEAYTWWNTSVACTRNAENGDFTTWRKLFANFEDQFCKFYKIKDIGTSFDFSHVYHQQKAQSPSDYMLRAMDTLYEWHTLQRATIYEGNTHKIGTLPDGTLQKMRDAVAMEGDEASRVAMMAIFQEHTERVVNTTWSRAEFAFAQLHARHISAKGIADARLRQKARELNDQFPADNFTDFRAKLYNIGIGLGLEKDPRKTKGNAHVVNEIVDQTLPTFDEEIAAVKNKGQGKKGGNRPKCTHCKYTGHLEPSCWKKYPEKRPARISEVQNNIATVNNAGATAAPPTRASDPNPAPKFGTYTRYEGSSTWADLN